MPEQISVNVAAASQIYTHAKNLIANIRQDLISLDKEIKSLETDGEWRGNAKDAFFGFYTSIERKVTQEFPDMLDETNENLDKNLRNLVAADEAGAKY